MLWSEYQQLCIPSKASNAMGLQPKPNLVVGRGQVHAEGAWFTKLL